ncbi:hypothetical protein NDU88_010283 [Pleurodeles waltl]|uniref:Uncharacterized protein n=1 Tax=Pleurodeles waltl TaxID=8319 RepID=A0AAV7Q1I0_PLEWA|nr:hypothetical protein NDU88_010283 [Pleurodeles waltl]
MSTQILTASGCLGFRATTMGETHGVGPDTFSMTPACSRRRSSCSTLGRRWNAIRRCLSAVGATDLSMCRRSGGPLRHPMPSNRDLKSCIRTWSALTWIAKEKCTRLRSWAVQQPSRNPVPSLETYTLVAISVSSWVMSVVKTPAMSSGRLFPNANTCMFVGRSAGRGCDRLLYTSMAIKFMDAPVSTNACVGEPLTMTVHVGKRRPPTA